MELRRSAQIRRRHACFQRDPIGRGHSKRWRLHRIIHRAMRRDNGVWSLARICTRCSTATKPHQQLEHGSFHREALCKRTRCKLAFNTKLRRRNDLASKSSLTYVQIQGARIFNERVSFLQYGDEAPIHLRRSRTHPAHNARTPPRKKGVRMQNLKVFRAATKHADGRRSNYRHCYPTT